MGLVKKSILELRRALAAQAGKSIGLVPTMGALHEGHLSLVRNAADQCDLVAVSIYVNPLQFGPKEDYNRYPRREEEDIDLAVSAGADLIFIPSVDEMGREALLTSVSVTGLSDRLCGRSRPGHFTGVTTIVCKLFNIVQPKRAYFGAKDWQQLAIVKRMADDLNYRIEIIACPTVRDSEGLALSSRNIYLSPDERKAALALPAALNRAKKLIEQGERDAETARQAAVAVIAGRREIKLEYLSIFEPETLGDLRKVDERAVIAGAVRIGRTRLIDNVVIGFDL